MYIPFVRPSFCSVHRAKLYQFSPVINRMDFIRNYRSGNNSVFLLYAMLATACVHASEDVVSAHGFESRAAAEESFFTKAKLTLDFDIEKDTLTMLQGSIILNVVMLDHPSNKDYDYWFHNAVRLATKLDLRNMSVYHNFVSNCADFHRCERESKPRKVLKLYRRIWWTLYVCQSPSLLCYMLMYLVSRHLSRLRQHQTITFNPRDLH